MRTTLDLPDSLMREVKIRAAREGRKLKELVAELLRRGLDAPLEGGAPVVVGDAEDEDSPFVRDPETGMLVVRCLGTPGYRRPTLEETRQVIAQANQEEDLRRAGLLD